MQRGKRTRRFSLFLGEQPPLPWERQFRAGMGGNGAASLFRCYGWSCSNCRSTLAPGTSVSDEITASVISHSTTICSK